MQHYRYLILLILTLIPVPIASMRMICPEFNPQEWAYVVARERELAQEKAAQAHKYNQKNQFLQLPNAPLITIALSSHDHDGAYNSIESLKKAIRRYIALKATCHHFNNLLTYTCIGYACENYNIAIKNRLFKEILEKRSDFLTKISLPMLILSSAGADMPIEMTYHTTDFFRDATIDNDSDVVAMLFKHQINPNAQWGGDIPVFYNATTIKTAQIFINNGTDILHMTSSGTNVLWRLIYPTCFRHECPSSLMAFYLLHGVRADTIAQNHNCLLHAFARIECAFVKDTENFFKKVLFVLHAIPHLINTINNKNETPLDTALNIVQKLKQPNQQSVANVQKLIDLFKKYGALTAQECIQRDALHLSEYEKKLHTIFSHIARVHKPDYRLKQYIKSLMQLRMVCNGFKTHFNAKSIGQLCAYYTQYDKDRLLQHLIKNIPDKALSCEHFKERYAMSRFPAMILAHSGADVNSTDTCDSYLLEEAVLQNDIELVKLLLTYNVNLNREHYGLPLFFKANTIEMAKLFINNNANIHTVNEGKNILWHLVLHNYPSKFMRLYLKHKVDAKTEATSDSSCLLHYLARSHYYIYEKIENTHTLLQMGMLLLNTIPEMINTYNNFLQTPLDVAQKSAKRAKTPEAFEQLTLLFREHGGFTAKELSIIQHINYHLPAHICDLLENMHNAEWDTAHVINRIKKDVTKMSGYMLGKILLNACELGTVNALRTLLSAFNNRQVIEILFSNKLLHYACYYGHSEIVKILIRAAGFDAPAYVCIKDVDGHTPLAYAALNAHKDSAQLLMHAAQDKLWHLLSVKDTQDMTVLMKAASIQKDDYFLLLQDLITAADTYTLEYVTITDKKGLTAIDHARIAGNGQALTFLQKIYKKLTTTECTLCLEEINNDAMYAMNGCNSKDGSISGCNQSFCKACLIEHIATQITDGSTLTLTCPNINCGKKMHHADVYALTQGQKDVYQRYDMIVQEEFILQNKNLRRCPTPGCLLTYEIEEGIRARVTCLSCKQVYCSHCRVQHALEMSCQEAYEHAQRVGNVSEEKLANEKWLEQHTKLCPRCDTLIEKNGGCLYMFCRKCGHEFCWKCLQPHDHTNNHPCGVWENEQVMNQAEQELIENLQQDID
jgi:hypothetical protein